MWFNLLLGVFMIGSGIGLEVRDPSKEYSEIKTVKTTIENEWILDIVKRYPDLTDWLADSDVKITNEGVVSNDQSYSEILFGKKFVEFDRSLMTIQCLHWFLDGSTEAYRQFCADQPISDKLFFSSFKSIHEKFDNLIKNNSLGLTEKEMIQMMESALVLGDLDKSEKARAKFDVPKEHVPDHDDCYRVVMGLLSKNSKLCKTFDSLPKAAQDFLVKTSIDIHFDQITHLEGNPNMFTGLKNSNWSNYELIFAFMIHVSDVSGALAHVNKNYSIVYTENTHCAMEANLEACLLLVGENKEATEKDAYDYYIEKRAEWLGLEGTDPIDRVTTRIGSMLRLFTPREGKIVKKALESLDIHDRESFIYFFDQKEKYFRTPTYMPAVLVNLVNNKTLGKTRDESLTKAIQLGISVITHAFTQYKLEIFQGKLTNDIPLNFNPLAEIAKTHPGDFENPDFMIQISKTGEVTLVVDHSHKQSKVYV